jgi:hypothetical protein
LGDIRGSPNSRTDWIPAGFGSLQTEQSHGPGPHPRGCAARGWRHPDWQIGFALGAPYTESGESENRARNFHYSPPLSRQRQRAARLRPPRSPEFVSTTVRTPPRRPRIAVSAVSQVRTSARHATHRSHARPTAPAHPSTHIPRHHARPAGSAVWRWE